MGLVIMIDVTTDYQVGPIEPDKNPICFFIYMLMLIYGLIC